MVKTNERLKKKTQSIDSSYCGKRNYLTTGIQFNAGYYNFNLELILALIADIRRFDGVLNVVSKKKVSRLHVYMRIARSENVPTRFYLTPCSPFVSGYMFW